MNDNLESLLNGIDAQQKSNIFSMRVNIPKNEEIIKINQMKIQTLNE